MTSVGTLEEEYLRTTIRKQVYFSSWDWDVYNNKGPVRMSEVNRKFVRHYNYVCSISRRAILQPVDCG